jgi:BRCA1-associated protein
MNGNHIYSHYESSLHTYAMNTQNRRVWDFAGDGYVHRLVLNATEGADSDQRQSYAQHESDEVSALKVVETCPLDRYNSQEMDSHMHDRRALPLSSEEEVSVVHRKLEAAAYHYNQLLSWQMQQNRLLFETQLQRIRESSSRSAPAAQVASGVNDWRSHMLESLRQEKARAARQLDVAKERLQRTTRERDVHAELSRSLLHNQGEWRDRLQRAQDMLRMAEDNYT